ncbi:YkgJ family cysteine cluster protein [Pseudodesulfovibrio piezophilus]|uniref:YkgJ family cysteine cluster protein n=1 Tax=Pseudodesulfovibrio piezophilus (strain DSM 21447 / JCM 15486 / C1TLV30) TaxID=1322246 RepID=M1WUU1_PSEP2|nr:hypothetical protein [Pseudodesulfovibrio piezophilus]CCH47863.1 protein of unknown function [Pseudodesulfovibrio piezophilus C1TLV30]
MGKVEEVVCSFMNYGPEALPDLTSLKFKKRLSAYLDIYREFLKLSDFIIDSEIGKRTVKCKPGCSFCCNQIIHAYPSELLCINEFLDKQPGIRNSFAEKYPQWDVDFEPFREAFWDSFKQMPTKRAEFRSICREFSSQCPFCDDGVCSIYAVRPMVCRTWFTKRRFTSCNEKNNKDKQLKLSCYEGLHMAQLHLDQYFMEQFEIEGLPLGAFVSTLSHGVFFMNSSSLYIKSLKRKAS